MRPTVKDVAKEAGVSTATVSNVLTQKKYVSDEITLRVKAAMTKLGYKPNSIARSLKVNRTFKIGIIVPNITNPFFGEIVEESEKVADGHGFQIILCTSQYDTKREKRSLIILLLWGLTGLSMWLRLCRLRSWRRSVTRRWWLWTDRILSRRTAL